MSCGIVRVRVEAGGLQKTPWGTWAEILAQRSRKKGDLEGRRREENCLSLPLHPKVSLKKQV